MNLNYIALAVPFFLFFMVLEYRLAKRKEKEIFHFNEAVANINVGIGERLADMLTTVAFFMCLRGYMIILPCFSFPKAGLLGCSYFY